MNTVDEVVINPRDRQKLLSSGVLAILLVIATELMFFGGLISAYLVKLVTIFSAIGNPESTIVPIWPPITHKNITLPVEITLINTVILLASAFTFQLSYKTLKNNESVKKALIWFVVTIFLGLTFVLIQGNEWAGLISQGFNFTDTAVTDAERNLSLLAAFFYTIIGMHALHVVVGLIVLFVMLVKQLRGTHKVEGFNIARFYWFFVVFLWPVLYFLVYLVQIEPGGFRIANFSF